MTPEQAKKAAAVIDVAFMLCAGMGSPIFIVVALLQYGVRRWPFACQGWLSIFGVKEVQAWHLVLLPGAMGFVKKEEKRQEEQTPLSAPLQLPILSAPIGGILSTEGWRDALGESPHLYVYGPSNAGKSTLAQAYVALLEGAQYVVIDPLPNKPGEKKWGGIDFITTDETGDEYASIKAALNYIDAEDDRRRRVMRNVIPPPLVVIIEEVLGLVGDLGVITNEEGKKEPRMTNFIRRKGNSARHRNIKIILIGQGKNLKDLGLESGTPRNNYALIRATRNPATNVRNAYIVMDSGEQEIDLRHVPALAKVASGRSQLWMSHADVTAKPTSMADELGALLGVSSISAPMVVTSLPTNQTNSNEPFAASGSAVTNENVVSNDVVTPAEAAQIGALLTKFAPSDVAKKLYGYTPGKYTEYKAKVDRVKAMMEGN